MLFADKVVLVTGAQQGIGRGMALEFAAAGADVAINYHPSEQRDADEVVALIRAAGRIAVAIPGDLRKESFCKVLVARAIKGLGLDRPQLGSGSPRLLRGASCIPADL